MNINGNIVEISSKNDVSFGIIAWILKARSTDALRPVMQKLYVDADYFVATDGHRLHLAENLFEFPAGLYDIIKNTKSTMIFAKSDIPISEYPDFWRVMPMNGNRERRIFHIGGTETGKFEADYALGIYEIFDYTKKLFNIKYLMDAFSMMGEWIIEKSTCDDPFKPLVMQANDTCIALVMPMQR